jgi:hypothetical protein
MFFWEKNLNYMFIYAITSRKYSIKSEFLSNFFALSFWPGACSNHGSTAEH